jgi:hypothetical protein
MGESRDERYGITKEFLRSIFYYVDDKLIWRDGRKSQGSTNSRGYLSYYIKEVKASFLIHRLVWIYHNGAIPPSIEIDHKDRDKVHNEIDNLRLVTCRQNMQNRALGSTGIRGVSWNKRIGRYQARVTVKGVIKSLGYFDCPHEAGAKYREASASLA